MGSSGYQDITAELTELPTEHLHWLQLQVMAAHAFGRSEPDHPMTTAWERFHALPLPVRTRWYQDVWTKLEAEGRRVEGRLPLPWGPPNEDDVQEWETSPLSPLTPDLDCHCGRRPIDSTSDHWPFLKGMCEDCAAVRCDAYPGACGGSR